MRCDSGTCSDGFRMNVLPVAMANGRNHIGTIAGKLNGAIAATDAERLADDVAVDAGRDVLEAEALHQRRRAARHLDALDAAPDAAARLVERLAVLGGDGAGELFEMLLRSSCLELVEDLRARVDRRVAPAGKRVRSPPAPPRRRRRRSRAACGR